MAMVGVRDMSIIETPPEDRYPVQTYVVEYSPELVREAIRREIDRGGQVYFVYNRVQTSTGWRGRCRNWCRTRGSRWPTARCRKSSWSR